MALHRFFTDGPMPSSEDLAGAGVVLPLSEGDIHHLRDVLRLDSGDEIILAGGGRAERVKLTAVGERVVGRGLGPLQSSVLPRVTLVQGLAKGEKMDDIVRHTTELGVARIIPLDAERSVVRLTPAKATARVERWRRIAAEAAKQAQRVDVPTVRALAAIEDLPAMLAGSVVLVCWEDADDAPGISEALGPDLDDESDVAVIVGPEGGLTEHEVRILAAMGATVVTLGPTVLRTETAGLVATALVIHERGGLGAR